MADLINSGKVYRQVKKAEITIDHIGAATCTTPSSSSADTNVFMGSGSSCAQALSSETKKSSPLPIRLGAAAGNTNVNTKTIGDIDSDEQVWWSQDAIFGFPRTVYFCQLKNFVSDDGHPVNSMITNIFSQLISRKYFQVGQTGLSYSVNVGVGGVNLAVYGFSPRLPQLAAEVATDFGSASFWKDDLTHTVFANSKERLIRSIKGFWKDRPDTQCDALLAYLMQQGSWLPMDRIEASEGLTLNYLRERVDRILQAPRVTSYAHGDLSSETTMDVHRKVTAALVRNTSTGGFAVKSPEEVLDADYFRPKILPRGSHSIVALPGFNKEDSNSALVCYMQASAITPESGHTYNIMNSTSFYIAPLIFTDLFLSLAVSKLMMVRQLLAEPLFTELRTKQQLGYIVSVSSSTYGKGMKAIRGLSFRVLSKQFSSLHIEKVLNEFLVTQQSAFAELTEEQLKERVDATITSLLDPPTSYSDEAAEFWPQITDSVEFGWKEKVIAAIQALTVKDVQVAADEWVFNLSTRASVSFMLFGNQHMDDLAATVAGSHGSSGSDKVSGAVDVITDIDGLRLKKKSLAFMY